MEIRDRCKLCKRIVNIGDIDYNELTCKRVNGKLEFTHINCWVEVEFAKKANKNTKKKLVENAKRRAQKYKADIDHLIVSKRLVHWLGGAYSAVSIPKWIISNIEDIGAGVYKNISSPIPLSDLFEMWQRYKHELDRIALYNQNKGKDMGMQGAKRMNYDLAILVNKYDDFVEWRESERARKLAHDEEIKNKRNDVNYDKLASTKKKSKKEDKDDFKIEDILDDIWGGEIWL